MPLTPGLCPLVPGPLALQEQRQFEVVVEMGRLDAGRSACTAAGAAGATLFFAFGFAGLGARLFISREVDREHTEVSALARRGDAEIEHGVCFGPTQPIHAPGRDNLTDNFHVKAGELGFFCFEISICWRCAPFDLFFSSSIR